MAAALRATQSAVSAEPLAARAGRLKDELTAALRELPAEERLGCLDALSERFPVWEGGRFVSSAKEDVETVSLPDVPPDELVARLLAAAPSLPESKRLEFARLLAEAGLTTSPKPPPFEMPAELRAQFPIPTGHAPDTGRALRLFAMLADVFTALDQTAWNVWRHLAPQSSLRRDPGPAGDFRRVSARYVSGEPEVTGQQVAMLLEKTRGLIVALLGAVAPAGGSFARSYLSRFSPETITAQTAQEGGGGAFKLLFGPERQHWGKYVELFDKTSGAVIEQEITNAVVHITESALRPKNPRNRT